MTRVTPDVIRSCQQMMERDPVDAAFCALACLSREQREQLQARFNAVFGRCIPPVRLSIFGG
jgi:hypothetical protein